MPRVLCSVLFQVFQDALLGSTNIPTDFDVWRSAKEMGEQALRYTDTMFKQASIEFTSAVDQINEFKDTMAQVVSSAKDLRIDGQNQLVARGFDHEVFTQKLSIQLTQVLEDLQAEFSEPLPEDQTERYRQRAVIITRALDKVEDALVTVYNMWDVDEATTREKFSHVKPHLNHVLLVTGNLIDNHPVIVTTLMISGALMILPEGFILRPLLQMFGFGPAGPVEGSVAAAAQRFFFGAEVPAGSWFGMLQRAGMKWSPGLGRKILCWIGGWWGRVC
ncbi:hypothetical protein B0H34DRAFT_796021 [Crassisporium funariophilum]|nr:hypothetical protein B0H34DRAFT_796021 [Crassisporium funariophilum]